MTLHMGSLEANTNFNLFLRAVVNNKWPEGEQKEWWYTKLGAVRRSKLLRVSEQQNHRCCYCGVTCWHSAWGESGANKKRATLEHVTAQSAGGNDHMNNLVMACNSCNGIRGDHDADWFFDLATQEGKIIDNVRRALELSGTQKVECEERKQKKLERKNSMIISLMLLLILVPEYQKIVDENLIQD